MKQPNQESHEFAFYSDLVRNISLLHTTDVFEVSNTELYHRIIKVLRLQIKDTIVLFNSVLNIQCQILDIYKDKFSLKVQDVRSNKKLLPEICWLLPLLKKEAFEDCLYSLTEMGIQEIQPVITRKSQQIAPYLESDRANNIMITAAEQSKQFILPHVYTAKPLDKVLQSLEQNPAGSNIFFDPAGSSFFDGIKDLKQNKATKIICVAGPEGDLTETEKQLLKDHNFTFYTLTETVLRAKQAVTIASGIIRTLVL